MRRLIVNLEGRDKTGKSRFALTAPDPIWYADFDDGLEGVQDDYTHKQLVVESYDFKSIVDEFWHSATPSARGFKGVASAASDQTVQAAKALWEKFWADCVAFATSDYFKTAAIDTGGDALQLVRLARFGRLTQEQQYHAPVNAEFKALMRILKKSGKNVIWLHKRKPEYVNNNLTGNYKMEGFKDVPFEAQVNAVCDYVDDEFKLTIVNSRINMAEVAGLEFTGDEIWFPGVAAKVYSGDESEWL